MKEQRKCDPRRTFPADEHFGRGPRSEQCGVKTRFGRNAKIAQFFVLGERLDHRQNVGNIARRGGQDPKSARRIHGFRRPAAGT